MMTKRQFILLSVLFACIMMCVGSLMPHWFDIDSYSYIKMVREGIDAAMQPYSKRILHPLIIQFLLPWMSEGDAFIFVQVVCTVVFYTAVLWLMTRMLDWHKVTDVIWLFALLSVPFIFIWAGDIYIQDMLVAALTALFFICLAKKIKWLATVLLFMMLLARESSVVVGFAWMISLWLANGDKKKNRNTAVFVLATVICALGLVGYLTRNAPSNVSNLPTWLYLPAKVVMNGVYNLTGIVPWNDAYATSLPHFYPNPPIWKMVLPTWLNAGGVHEIGIYEFQHLRILTTLRIWFLSFPAGLIMLVLVLWRTKRGELVKCLKEMPLWITVALVTGLIMWCLIPFTGRTIERHAGYAWPFWWIALPWMWKYEFRV